MLCSAAPANRCYLDVSHVPSPPRGEPVMHSRADRITVGRMSSVDVFDATLPKAQNSLKVSIEV